MQGLRAAENSRRGLQRYTNDVVVDLLRRQHRACGLRVYTQFHGFVFLRAETFFQDARPKTTGCTEFRNFFEYVVVRVPEEGQTTCKFVDFHAGFQCRFDVCDTVSDRESDFLCRSRTRFTDVVAGDRNRVPFRNVLRAVFKNVGDQTHRRFRREDVGAASRVFFQDVVLDRAAQLVRGYALFFRNGNVHRQENGRRSVDRHRCRNFTQVDLVEQDFHVGERIDRNAYFTNFAGTHRIVRVVTDLGRQVECAGKTRRTVFNQVTVTLVGFFGRSETGIHTHRPETAAVHRRLYAAGVRVAARQSQVAVIVKPFDIERGVDFVVLHVRTFRVFGIHFSNCLFVCLQFGLQGFVSHVFIILLKNINIYRSLARLTNHNAAAA